MLGCRSSDRYAPCFDSIAFVAVRGAKGALSPDGGVHNEEAIVASAAMFVLSGSELPCIVSMCSGEDVM